MDVDGVSPSHGLSLAVDLGVLFEQLVDGGQGRVVVGEDDRGVLGNDVSSGAVSPGLAGPTSTDTGFEEIVYPTILC